MTIAAADNWKRLIGEQCHKEYSNIVGACALEIVRELLSESNTDVDRLSKYLKVVANCCRRGDIVRKDLKVIFSDIPHVAQPNAAILLIKKPLRKIKHISKKLVGGNK
jgi:hypothetical protein